MLKETIDNRKFYEAFAAVLEIVMLLGACILLLRAATGVI